MRIFNTYLYEVLKGTKPVALVTVNSLEFSKMEKMIKKSGLDFVVQKISNEKINLFFGKKECVDVIKTFLKPLNELNPYEDFVLGTILGYDTKLQCERFLLKSKFKETL